MVHNEQNRKYRCKQRRRFPSGSRLLIDGIALIVGLIFSAICMHHSSIAYYRTHPSESVSQRFLPNPDILLEHAVADFFDGKLPPDKLVPLARIARETLVAEPLEPRALYVIGIANAVQRKGDGSREFSLAETISRRHIPVEFALAAHYQRRGDIRNFLVRMDRVFTILPNAVKHFGSMVVGQIDKNIYITELQRYGGRPWLLQIIQQAIASGRPYQEIVSLIEFAEKAKFRDPDITRMLASFRVKLLLVAVERNDIVALKSQISDLPITMRVALGGIGFTGLGADERLRPFTWSLANDNLAQTSIFEPNSLRVWIRSGRAAVVAERITVMPPGPMHMKQTVASELGGEPVIFEWQVTCMNKKQTRIYQDIFASEETPKDRKASFYIPEECPIQRWQLHATGNSAQYESWAEIRGVQISTAVRSVQ